MYGHVKKGNIIENENLPNSHYTFYIIFTPFYPNNSIKFPLSPTINYIKNQ